MHRDALADGASKALDKIFGPLPVGEDVDMLEDDTLTDDDCDGCEDLTTILIGILCITQIISLFVICFTCYRLRKVTEDEGMDDDTVKNSDGFALTRGVLASSKP